MENVEIIDYEDKYQAVFREMNLYWLDKYNLTESHDLMILDDPRGTIIERGGYLWLAKCGEEIVGSAGIMKEHDDVFEIAKMVVKAAYHGRGISKLLLSACINKARELGAARIILFSNHQLTTALALYEKFGFRHVAVEDSPFTTADVKMELELN